MVKGFGERKIVLYYETENFLLLAKNLKIGKYKFYEIGDEKNTVEIVFEIVLKKM